MQTLSMDRLQRAYHASRNASQRAVLFNLMTRASVSEFVRDQDVITLERIELKLKEDNEHVGTAEGNSGRGNTRH